VRRLLFLISGLRHTRIGLREEIPVQIKQGLALFAVAFDEKTILKVNELQVKGRCLRMEKGPPFTTDAETIFHGLTTGDGDECKRIPPILVVEVTKVSQIEVIQPVKSHRVTGSHSQEHPFFGRSLRNG
jgi:hypothetical protein